MSFPLTPSGVAASYGAGLYGQGMTAGRVKFVGGVLPSATQFTVDVVFKTTGTGTAVAVGQSGAFWIGTLGSGNAYANLGTGGSAVGLTSSVNIANDAFHTARLAVNASGAVLLIDGVVAATTSTTPTAAGVALGADFCVHYLSDAFAFDWGGTVDEVAVWSSYLPNAYTPTVTSNSATDLVAVWHLDGDLLDSKAAAPVPATEVTISGPTSGSVGAASSNFTVAANGTITGTVTVTPSAGGGGGTFTPSSVAISSGTPTATFTYTPASTGSKSISVTNNGGLSNPTAIAFTAGAATLYARVDATEAISAQAIMVLVPSGASSNPYNSANPTKVIIYCHGHGEDQTALLTDSLKAGCVNALLDAGCILAGCNANGSDWGSQTAINSYAGLARYLKANYNVHPAGFAIWSQSMGGLPGLGVVAQNRVGGIVGWLGTYPVCNLANLYSLGTYTGTINGSYGITGTGSATYANLTYGMDPVLRAASDYRDIPVRIYSSRADTVVPGDQNGEVLQALLAGSRIESTLIQCSGNHGDPSHFVPSEYVAFFGRCYTYATKATRTVAVTLTSDGTTPRANATGLKWSVRESSTPGNSYTTPIASGTTGATSAAGLFSVSVSTYIAPGATVWLDVTSSDGTVAQSPMGWQWSGPVAVA